MTVIFSQSGFRAGARLCAAVAALCLLAVAPMPAAADDGNRQSRQVAQTVSPFVAKWTWASRWGPITLNITSVLPDGRARGELVVTVSKGIRRFQLVDKTSGVEMVGKVKDGIFVGRLNSGTNMHLKLVDGKLVGPYNRGDGQKTKAVFVK